MNENKLGEGCRVLVIEDEALLSMALQDLLVEMGCIIVGSASRLDEAAIKAETLTFDIALLDINLHGEQTVSVAEAMHARGQAFAVVSGYCQSMLPEALRSVPLLQKPYRKQDLAAIVRAALDQRRADPHDPTPG